MNVKMMVRSKLLTVLCLLCAFSVRAQYHRYEAKVPAVSSAGFYKLVITPEVSAYAATDLHDLRIRDEQGREVRYLRNTELPQHWGGFIPFSIESRRKGTDGNSHIRLRNSLAGTIEAIQLQFRNTSALRPATVRGSSDGKTWYTVRDSFVLHVEATRGDTAVFTIPLPAVSYPHLEITISDEGRPPLKLLRAGVVSANALRPHYIELPPPTWTRADSSDQNTYLQLRFRRPYMVQKLSFQFESPTYYHREAELYSGTPPAVRFIARYNTPASVWTDLHDSMINVVVHNEDNPPLTLKSVTASQQQQYLLTYLDAGIRYTLTFSDSTLSAPRYDFRFFKDSLAIDAMQEITPALPEVHAQKLPANGRPLIGKPVMWAIILVVLFALIMGTLSLMKQIKPNE